MFEGVKSPPKPAPDSAKSNDKTTEAKQPGVPTSHAFGWLMIPVLALLGIWLYSVSHVAALVVGIAVAVLLVLGLAARWFTRRVTQDVADKMSGKKAKDRGREPRQPRQPRQWGPRGWTPRGGGSGGARNGSRGAGRPGGRSSDRQGGGRGRPGADPRGNTRDRTPRRSMRDRMTGRMTGRNRPGGAPKTPGQPPGGKGRNGANAPGGRLTPGKGATTAPGSGKTPGQGRSRNPFRRNRNNGGNGSKLAGGKPGTGGRGQGGGTGAQGGGGKRRRQTRAHNDQNLGWPSRNRDKSDAGKPSKGGKSKDQGGKDPQKQSRWQWWTERNEPAQPPAPKGGKQAAKADDQQRKASAAPAPKPRRQWIPKFRRAPKPDGTNPHVERLDQVWESRGFNKSPRDDPAVAAPVARAPKRKAAHPAASSAEAGLNAEGDWAPTPAASAHDHTSAEAGLMAEGWAPKPQPPKQPTPAAVTAHTEGAVQMSNSGQDASTATNRAAAYNHAANAAAMVQQKKQNLANAKRQQAAALANREGTEGAAAGLAASASKLQQDAATMGGFAGTFRQLAATTANIFRR